MPGLHRLLLEGGEAARWSVVGRVGSEDQFVGRGARRRSFCSNDQAIVGQELESFRSISAHRRTPPKKLEHDAVDAVGAASGDAGSCGSRIWRCWV